MKCPFCGDQDTKVIDSRSTNNDTAIRRRRECLKCHFRFSTHEELELLKLSVIKKDGRKEPYDREKIIGGIKQACEKRLSDEKEVLRMVNYIEQDILNLDQDEVNSKIIGSLVIDYLKKVDEVAYLRFASVYKDFKSADGFIEELKNLENNQVKKFR